MQLIVLTLKPKLLPLFGEKTFQRIQNLYNEGVVPEQQRDEAETKMKSSS